MAIKGPTLSKEVLKAAVVNKEPKALANAFAYTVKKTAGEAYEASVAELPELTHKHADFITAQNELKQLVIAHLTSLSEESRPDPIGILNKATIDKAKEVPKHIRKAYGREMAN